MDGKQHFQRATATDRLDDPQPLQGFYELSHTDRQTNTVPARYGPQRASDPRLNETRATPTTA